MLGRRTKQIATAGLVLAAADLAWAQGVPAKPAPSPAYPVRPAGAPDFRPPGAASVVLPGAGSPLPCYEGTQFPGLALGGSGSVSYLFGPAVGPPPGAPLG